MSRIYDVVTNPQNIYHDSVREFVPLAKGDRWAHEYWARVLRCAALCHDLGHLPFSHAAEKELLPEGWEHERNDVDRVRRLTHLKPHIALQEAQAAGI
jgi:uncharacterized protein